MPYNPKSNPFYALRIMQVGFDDDSETTKRERMRIETRANGGFVVNLSDLSSNGDQNTAVTKDEQSSLFVTHIVVNEARFGAYNALANDQRTAWIRSLVNGGDSHSPAMAPERAAFHDLLSAVEAARRHNESLLREFHSESESELSVTADADTTMSLRNANRAVAMFNNFTLRVVRSDWFWQSLQIDACVNENAHRFCYGEDEGSAESEQHSFNVAETGLCRTPPALDSNELSQSQSRRLSRTESRFSRFARFLSRATSRRDRDRDREQREKDSTATEGTRDSTSSLGTLRSGDSHAHRSQQADRSNTTRKSVEKDHGHTHTESTATPTVQLQERSEKLFELLYTETNYVEILDIVARRLPTELCDPNQPGGATLSTAEARRLFARFEPVLALHASFKSELERVLGVQVQLPYDRRTVDVQKDVSAACVGDCIRRLCAEFEKAYSRVINDFEHVRDELQRMAAENGRFYAFLELLRRRPDCGRQDLADLLIRPVQRLPSLTLILAKMLACTPRSHSDFGPLKDALDALQKTLARINENKRAAEKHKELFALVSEIKHCPATLLSSQRYVVAKAALLELAAARRGHMPLVGPLQPLVLLLFNDVIEFCTPRVRAKPRSARLQSQAQPQPVLRGYESAANLSSSLAATHTHAPMLINGSVEQPHANLKRKVSDRETLPQKGTYKHVKVLTLASVRGVIDITDSSASVASPSAMFAILYDVGRNDQLLGTISGKSHLHSSYSTGANEQLVAFALVDAGDTGVSKREFLDTLCRQIVSVSDNLDVCADSLLIKQDAALLNIDTDLDRSRRSSIGTMNAFRRGTRRVSIALSSFRKDVRTSQPPPQPQVQPQSTPPTSVAPVTGYYGPSRLSAELCGASGTLADVPASAGIVASTSAPSALSRALAIVTTPVRVLADSDAKLDDADASCVAPMVQTCRDSDDTPIDCDLCLSPAAAAAATCASNVQSQSQSDRLLSPYSVSSLEIDDIWQSQWQPTRTPDSTSESSAFATAPCKTSRKKSLSFNSKLKLFGLPIRMPSIRRQKVVESIREERSSDADRL